MQANADLCQICEKQAFKYTCPKCNIRYCSVACYKLPAHLQCSEQFYKDCVQQELSAAQPHCSKDMHKIYDILKRMHELDAGIEPTNTTLDSDDDDDEAASTDEDDADQDNATDLAARLQNVNINNAEQVWQHLTAAERQEFEDMLESGEIMKLLPNYKPWWIQSKIVVMQPADTQSTSTAMPKIKAQIAPLADICQKTPSLCVFYNLCNVLAAYACTVRWFDGEHLQTACEAAAHLVNLSATLKYGTNFEETQDAIVSVEMEALTTGNGTNSATTVSAKLVESREQLMQDANALMSTRIYKLAALSDIWELLQFAKIQIKQSQVQQAELQKLFALCTGSIELNRQKLLQLQKRIEFFLSYVKSDAMPTKT